MPDLNTPTMSLCPRMNVMRQRAALLALATMMTACAPEPPSPLAVACYRWSSSHLQIDLHNISKRGVGQKGLEVYGRLVAPISLISVEMLKACAEGRATKAEILTVRVMATSWHDVGLKSLESLSAAQVESITQLYERFIALLERVRPLVTLPLPPES